MSQEVTIENVRIGETLYIQHFEHYGVPYIAVSTGKTNVTLQKAGEAFKHQLPITRKASMLSRTPTTRPEGELSRDQIKYGMYLKSKRDRWKGKQFRVIKISKKRIKVVDVCNHRCEVNDDPEMFVPYSDRISSAEDW